MRTEERFSKLLTASAHQLAAVVAALAGQCDQQSPPMRLIRISEAARLTGLSRSTIWRAAKEGRIRTIEVRRGSRRIPEAELQRFAQGK